MPVILCGGSGTRLWPLSRESFPKQFLEINGETLFGRTLRRVKKIKFEGTFSQAPLIIGNVAYEFIIKNLLEEENISGAQLLLEPCPRNTAAALTFAAIIQKNEDPILIVLPSDHLIGKSEEFESAINTAIASAQQGSIAILGAHVTSPETGFGYAEVNEKDFYLDKKTYNVLRFIEKPTKDLAIKFLESDHYFWNVGIFVLRASTWLKAINQCRPDILQAALETLKHTKCDVDVIKPDLNYFEKIPADSIDYAVMEKCSKINQVVELVPLNTKWSDLGSWESLWRSFRSLNGNFLDGDTYLLDTKDSLVISPDKLTVAVGLENVAIVNTKDALLVMDIKQSQKVKNVVSELEKLTREEVKNLRKVVRPWGAYETLEEGKFFKVKRIIVSAHQALSLQRHRFRSEHWVVVQGQATVQCGDKVFQLSENQSTFIPQYEIHRLSNQRNEDLVVIEVQSGEYLSEDDIERLDDIYGRY